MRVLVTGAGGNLGRCVVPVLEQAGHDLRLFDFRPIDSPHETLVGDLRERDVVSEAMQGVDAVVHGAALHGIHLDAWSPDEFWSTNVTGTFIVYDAARRAGIAKIALASSMAVYGVGAGSPREWPVVSELSPLAPRDLYGLTKVIAEQTARFYADAHGIDTVALRLGMFVPETFERYGFRLLFGGVDDRDVAQAVGLALDHQPTDGFAAFNVMADNGLRPADVADFARDTSAALEARWPGAGELVARRGIKLTDLVWGGALYTVETARRELGYRPAYDFNAFLQAWRKGRSSHYPYAHEPWWGAQRPAF
jgi:UDP-glucose 4-epimerase